MEVMQPADALYQALARAIRLAAALVLVFWFLDAVMVVLLLFAAAAILAVALNPPVTWLEHRKVPRALGTLLVSLGVATVTGLLGWLVVPRLVEQAAALAADLPGYATAAAERVTDVLADTPALDQQFQLDAEAAGRLLPTFQGLLSRVGRYTLSAVGLVAFLLVLISLVLYMVASPRPLLRGLLLSVPQAQRDPTARAFAGGSQMVSAWLWSNVIVGALEAAAVAVALSWLGVPGALVWAALAFFAELVPKLGPYLMAIPPILVALAVDPLTALWVLLFYIVLNEIMGDLVTPLVRGSRMNIHPAILLVATLMMAAAFGLLGALISTPLAGFAKALYEEFYLARQPADPDLDRRVEQMLEQRDGGE